MKNIFKNIIVGFFLLTGTIMYAQETMDSAYQIKLISAYFENPDKVILRWVPSSPGFWRLCNYYGYILERAELDTVQPKIPEWTVLANPKPISLEEWRQKVLQFPKDTMLMVAGQAIHGEKNNAPFSMENLMLKNDQLQNYYSACVLASEFSVEASLASALRYEDTKIKKNASYLYRLRLNTKDSTLQNIQVVTSVNTRLSELIPPVHSVEIKEGERLIELLWNRIYFKNYYSAFNIYRSENQGKTWTKLNKKPVSYLAYKDENKYIYRDSVQQNYIVYQYKIEGITPYAIVGPMSEVFSAQGRDRTPPEAPHNVTTKYLGNKKMMISWDVNKADKDIAGFRISRSNEIDKGFVELTNGPLPANTRTFMDTTCNELVSNYYFIGILDNEGNVNVSMPQYGTIIDSVPPGPPVGLAGSIDTNGVVTLTWRLGKEPDLKGYFVHYSNNIRHTFINVTDFHLEDTLWRDTIPLNVLTEEIHYKVVAIDHRSNYSPYSSMITLKKPDLVPPASPIFITSESKPEGIEIQWYNSSSVDVLHNLLLRRIKGNEAFEVIHKVLPNRNKTIFLDKNITPGVKYEYQLVAVDDAGLESKKVGVLSATGYNVKTIKPVQSFLYSLEKNPPSCLLKWEHPDAKNVRFVLYRALNEQPYTLYKSLEKVTNWSDKSYSKGENVRYKIKVVNAKGWQSDFSEELVVQW